MPSAGTWSRDRSIPISGWLELKRQVRKGEKGISLCMPMQYKKRVPKDDERKSEESEEVTTSCGNGFVFRNYWFVLAQTEGETHWTTHRSPALTWTPPCNTLNITRTAFDEINGNIQGFAHQREIAISPIAAASAQDHVS